jgi:acyl-CoA dehydrogenase
MRRSVFTEDHEAFRATVRDFIAREVAPRYAGWEKAGQVPRDLYRKLGEIGALGIEAPEENGGSNEIQKTVIAKGSGPVNPHGGKT